MTDVLKMFSFWQESSQMDPSGLKVLALNKLKLREAFALQLRTIIIIISNGPIWPFDAAEIVTFSPELKYYWHSNILL